MRAGHDPSPPEFGADFREGLLALLHWRRDVRQFRREPLPPGTLEELIRIACLSPSVGLSEPWRFVLAEDPARRAAMRDCFEDCNSEALESQAADRAALYARLKLAGLDDAPGQVSVFADASTGQGRGLGRATMPETITYSVVIAIHTLWLAARAQGFGVGWVSILDPKRMIEILDVPPAWIFVGHLCIGIPAEERDTPLLQREGWEERRPPDETIIYR